jgi:AAA ATPase domain
MNIHLPFVGRSRETTRLQRLHAQRRHILILGPEGVGKSALVEQLHESLNLRVCPASEHLSEICDSLEQLLGLKSVNFGLVNRKNRVLKLLKGAKDTVVVFDNASWTTPRLGSFIENVSERVPVWLCVRSEHPWDVGRIWPLLVRFERVELKPFHPKETQKLVAAAVRENMVPEKTLGIVDWLHRRAEGRPKIVCELLTEIARGRYDLDKPHSLRLLDLDRRIHEIFPTKTYVSPLR